MKYKDYYAVMGVARDATQDEIKRAYRKLARIYHPDVSSEPNAEARFKEIREAYEVLKDPEKRAAYDELGANWKAGQDFRPPPDWNEGSGNDSTFAAPGKAALGATVEIPTPSGPVDLKIPASSSGGRKLRLKRRGIPAMAPGDLYVVRNACWNSSG